MAWYMHNFMYHYQSSMHIQYQNGLQVQYQNIESYFEESINYPAGSNYPFAPQMAFSYNWIQPNFFAPIAPMDQALVCHHTSAYAPGFACSVHGIVEFPSKTQVNGTFKKPEARPTIPGPNVRLWENVSNEARQDRFRFKILSYNVLSQILLESHLFVYKYCEKDHLKWQTRSENIFNEILSLDPDIFCLQEVQESHLAFFRRFNELGYSGIFKKKTGVRIDGCAIFFKDAIFDMTERFGVEYTQRFFPLLSADNIGLIVKLTPKAFPNNPLLIVTTHLVSGSLKLGPTHKYKSISRTAQMRILLNEIDRLSFNDETEKHCSVVLTGDFNSTPTSVLIKLLSEGEILIPIEESLQHLGLPEEFLKQYSAVIDLHDGTITAPIPQFKIVRHPYKFSSVYDPQKMLGTTYIGKWLTVDYIYYTNENLKLIERLGFPTQLSGDAIPNEVFGSDHVAMGAVIEMTDTLDHSTDHM